jgi:hypothetical protein
MFLFQHPYTSISLTIHPVILGLSHSVWHQFINNQPCHWPSISPSVIQLTILISARHTPCVCEACQPVPPFIHHILLAWEESFPVRDKIVYQSAAVGHVHVFPFLTQAKTLYKWDPSFSNFTTLLCHLSHPLSSLLLLFQPGSSLNPLYLSFLS